MKRIIRIATLLTVIALGIENVPGAQAFISEDDSIVSVNKKDKLTEYKGIRVDPKPIDLLWQNDYQIKTKKSPAGKVIYSQNVNETSQEKSNYYSPDCIQNELFYMQYDIVPEINRHQTKLKQ